MDHPTRTKLDRQGVPYGSIHWGEADIMLATLSIHFLSQVLPAQLEPQSQEVNNTRALESVTSGQGMGRMEAVAVCPEHASF